MPSAPLVRDNNDLFQRQTRQALLELADSVTEHVTGDLAIGDNRVPHSLGRVPKGVHLTPTVASASFAWALKAKDTKSVTITVIGTAQPGATVGIE